MTGGDRPKASHPKSRRDSSSSSAAPKPKPSPRSTANNPTNNESNKDLSKPNLKPTPENPVPGHVIPNHISEPKAGFPFAELPPPPSYGFHMLDRRSIVLVDGSVRSYFALPPDYDNFAHILRPIFRPDFHGRHGFGLDGPRFPMNPEFLDSDARVRNPEHWNMGPLKRKLGEEERGGRDDGLERQRQQLLQYGNADAPGPSVPYNLGRGGEDMRAPKSMRVLQGNVSKHKHSEVDQNALNKAFLHFVKLVFETANQKKHYMGDGKQGHHLKCLPCGRSSKVFPDTHSLIMHAYNSENADSIVDHLAFHKALCILMGWDYSMPPDNSRAYQNFSPDDAESRKYDLILWPPSVLIHNTITGTCKDGRVECIGNRAMDSILRDLGFTSGKSTALYAREGPLGIHSVKFSSDDLGVKDALQMTDYFAREKRGRKEWARFQPLTLGGGKVDENDVNLVKLDPNSGEKKKVLYGHLATVVDLEKISFDIKKKVSVVSLREMMKY